MLFITCFYFSPAKDEFLAQLEKIIKQHSPRNSPAKSKPVSQIDRARSRSPKKRDEPESPSSSSDSEDDCSGSENEEDFNLVEEHVEIDFSQLQVRRNKLSAFLYKYCYNI